MSEKDAKKSNGLRVVVCEDHALFRPAQMVLEQEALELVGEASDGVEVVTKLRS